ncbi:alpha/beta fold hydrolase [Thermaurantiacus sp.]
MSRFVSFDGTEIAFHEMGEGQPLLLLHGLFSCGEVNWIRYGTAARLVEAGFRLILPDLRGHGASQAPRDPAAWPEDVLAKDAEALVAHLALGPELVVGGYSLGARTVVRLLARGIVRPRAAILAGMGLEGITGGSARSAWFARMIEGRGSWARNTREWFAEAFMKANVQDPEALLHLLRAQRGTPAEVLAGFDLPVAVLCGTEDQDNGAAAGLAAALPKARLLEIPGTHMSAVTRPEFAAALLDALSGFRASGTS